MTYLDAHNHLHDKRLSAHRETVIKELASLSLSAAVVNGTREEDWPEVLALCQAHSWCLPSLGLHPWYVPERSPGWYDELRGCLQSHPHVAVGEIGLDRWIESHDLQDQTKVFTTQLDLAVELDRPVTIHCLHAWGALWKIAQQRPLPGRGFLLHAYGGSPEMVAGFAERGAYFSFSPYFLHQRKGAQRAAFQRVPLDRLLVETDAPDMRPPDDQNPRSLKTDDGSAINHPANIDIAYAALAEVRQMPLEELVGKVAGNFERLFRR